MRTMICDACQCVLESDRSDAECQAEYELDFGDSATDDKMTVCEDCYSRFWDWARENIPELMAQA